MGPTFSSRANEPRKSFGLREQNFSVVWELGLFSPPLTEADSFSLHFFPLHLIYTLTDYRSFGTHLSRPVRCSKVSTNLRMFSFFLLVNEWKILPKIERSKIRREGKNYKERKKKKKWLDVKKKKIVKRERNNYLSLCLSLFFFFKGSSLRFISSGRARRVPSYISSDVLLGAASRSIDFHQAPIYQF